MTLFTGGTQALCTDRLPAEQKHPQRTGVSPADTGSSPGGTVQPSSLCACSSGHSACSRGHPFSTPPALPAGAGLPLLLVTRLLFPSPENRTFILCWGFKGIQLGSLYYEQLLDYILKSRHTKLKKSASNCGHF